MMEEKLKDFLLECHNVGTVRRAQLARISKLIDNEIEEAIDSDPRFAIVVRDLLNGEDFDEIVYSAQLNCTVEEYMGLK